MPSAHETERKGLAAFDGSSPGPDDIQGFESARVKGVDSVRNPLCTLTWPLQHTPPPDHFRASQPDLTVVDLINLGHEAGGPQAATGTPRSPTFSMSAFDALTRKIADSIATTRKPAPMANPIT